jgi:ABC-2 type transport system ATP-binding protein
MIKVRNLVKRYGTKTAVNQLDLEVQPGEIFGLLGPNGAGKTTTIRMLTTLCKPDQGEIVIAGHNLHNERDAVRRMIGVVPQERNLDLELTVQENLMVYARLYHLKNRQQRIDECLEQFGLTQEQKTQTDTLSGGMQRRLLIARALLSRPRILFLDEPSIGLDPQIRRGIWDSIAMLRNDGVTIVLTTHYMDEAAILCNRIGLMSHGRLLMTDTPDNLQIAAGSFMVEAPDNSGFKRTLCRDQEQAETVAAALPGALIRPANLEDAFIALTGQEL